MEKNLIAVVGIVMLSACAKVSVYPLKPDGARDCSQREGVRYYLPKPYLLVAEVPVEKEPIKAGAGGTEGLQKKGGSQDKKKASGGQQKKKDATPNPSKSPDAADSGSGDSASAATDTSFSMFTKQYGLKLIYLPDYCHPMAISESPGLFGTASMKPTLQDGWMLTALDASSDSKTAETLTAVAALVGAIHGGGGGSGATGSSGKGTSTEGLTVGATVSPVLPPGLYRLNYQAGVLRNVCPVTLFTADGPAAPESGKGCEEEVCSKPEKECLKGGQCW